MINKTVLAKYLNLTTGHISQDECGTNGTALAILNAFRCKGIDALL